MILTENLADFPEEDTGPECVDLNAAHLFGQLAETHPSDLAGIVERASAGLTKPPLLPLDILDLLADIGLGDTAELVRPHLQ